MSGAPPSAGGAADAHVQQQQAGEEGGAAQPRGGGDDAPPPRSALQRVAGCLGCEKGATAWFVDNHLLVFLFIAFVIGLAAPSPGKHVSKPTMSLGVGSMRAVQFANIVIIFLISGFRIKTDAALAALRAPAALLWAAVLILLVTPCVGFATAQLPLEPHEFRRGLTLFCCVPTTLTSGAALVSGCKGAMRATELALMITISTNLVGCFTVPVGLKATLHGMAADLDVPKLVVKLCITMLAPAIVGKLVQAFVPGAAAFSKRHKVPLTIFSNFNLVFVVWQTVSRAQSDITSQPAGHLLACIGCGLGLHFVFWAINFFVFFVPGIPDGHQRRAVFLLASQKTLPVSMAVISGLPDTFGKSGLIALPCILSHLSQLIVDSFVVTKWARDPLPLPAEKEDLL